MSDEITPVMGNDEWTLYKELYDAIMKAQKRGVSMQMALGHVKGLELHMEYLLIRQIRDDQLPTRDDVPPPAAASPNLTKEK